MTTRYPQAMRAPSRLLRSSLRAISVLAALLGPVVAAQAATHVVCAEDGKQSDCQFRGGSGIQQAVDAAADGDTIQLRAGRYTASAFKDVPYKIHTIRGFVLIEGKNLTLLGEPGAILDGATGTPTTAIVVHRAQVNIEELAIDGFRFAEEEDEIYEGHGIFAIDSRVQLSNVTISRFQKMGLTGRGDTIIDARNVRILDGHVAIWLHESAYLRLTNSLVRGNDGSAIAAYDRSVAHATNCVFDGNLDDGLYTEHEAAMYVTNSLLLRNKPYAVRALDRSRIWLAHSALFGNQANTKTKKRALIQRGPNVIEMDPRVDGQYRLQPDSPLIDRGDPDVRGNAGETVQAGLR
ncbi:right-handed parallel beta-helix repeat-containing protein [Steroidobacter sp.]|uniref:right-handed parallel beta-helix repeat-containing protein n=1 Tax=Steroidobacter sp. TaxID=1978227 RepID=UPI001A5DA083|nr:right-handed parallel beta-helix repeat-containing protein [Steroidobacter sp.]MBL8267773.1 right-handed parallel beta-helix repeat-containing protein [Steroidobacter sp.]